MAEVSMKQRFENMKFKRYRNRFLRIGKMEISEGDLQQQIEQLLQFYCWRYYHTWNSRRSVEGFPDLIALRRHRKLVAELKKEGEEPTREQQNWLDEFEEVGFEVYIWHPADVEQAAKVLR